jgi:hypothetical protein
VYPVSVIRNIDYLQFGVLHFILLILLATLGIACLTAAFAPRHFSVDSTCQFALNQRSRKSCPDEVLRRK